MWFSRSDNIVGGLLTAECARSQTTTRSSFDERLQRRLRGSLSKLESSRLVGVNTNLQQLSKMSLTRIAISAELRGTRSAIERAEAPRLLLQRRFELLQRLRWLIHLQQHLAQQLARRCQRTGRHRAFFRPIFQFRCRPHLPQCFLFL